MYILIKSMEYTHFSSTCFEVLNILLLLVVICIKYENVELTIEAINSKKCLIFLNRDQTEIA